MVQLIHGLKGVVYLRAWISGVFLTMDCEKTTHDIAQIFFYLISTVLKIKKSARLAGTFSLRAARFARKFERA